MGTLLFVLLLGAGVCGLLLPSVRRTQAVGRRLAQVGFLGALGLLALFVVVSVLTLPLEAHTDGSGAGYARRRRLPS